MMGLTVWERWLGKLVPALFFSFMLATAGSFCTISPSRKIRSHRSRYCSSNFVIITSLATLLYYIVP